MWPDQIDLGLPVTEQMHMGGLVIDREDETPSP